MANNFTTVAPESTAPIALKVATVQLDDLAQAGVSVIVDSTGARANTLGVNASRQALVRAAEIETAIGLLAKLTDTQPVSIAGTVATNGLTDAQLRATAVPVSGTVATGGLSDTQLRATAVPVSGVFWQATQPVSGSVSTGGLTDAQLRAAAVPVSGPLTDAELRATAVPVSGTVSTGGLTDAQLRASAIAVSVGAASATYRGRAATFSTPGRAGTAGQKIFAMHNASGSAVVVTINSIAVDLVQLAAIAVTVRPVIIRVYRVTVLPTNGTALTKVARDTTLASSASVTVFGDSSSDDAGSAATLTATLPAGSVLTQTYAARLITAAGYEPFDRETFLDGSNVQLQAGEGLVVMLDYTLITQNPTGNRWLVACEWDEA